jgi:hypothetical protein
LVQFIALLPGGDNIFEALIDSGIALAGLLQPLD